MTRIIESVRITKSVEADPYRLNHPRSGDFVRWPDGSTGQIEDVETGLVGKGEAMVCESLGSAFLREDGTVDISGGPFRAVQLSDLSFAIGTYRGRFWNWGDNRPGADMGCEFYLIRPLYEFTGEMR